MDGPLIAAHRWDRFVADPRPAPVLASPRLRPSTGWVMVLVWVAVIGLAAGVPLVASGLSQLRWAYLHREATGEGVGFFRVAALAGPGGLLCLGSAGALLAASRGLAGRLRAGLVVLAGAVLTGLAVGVGVGSWVEGQSGCIGPCG